MLKKISYGVLSIAFVLSLLFAGCSFGSSPTGSKPAASSNSAVTPGPARGLTGTFSVGKTLESASASIISTGGKVTVSQADSPIKGLELSVPSGSYKDKRDFKISSAPIEKHSFGEDFNPITPLITVDNGGEYSAEDMLITIPVTIPSGKFAMGFLYNEKTKILEGMPVMAESATSITVTTRHFSSFVISMIDKLKLKRDIDSDFRPGIDDWQFGNHGSFIEPGGQCAGQSISAMWYYYNQPDGKDLTLYGRYDNNGDKPATPDIWEDDSLGYRLACMVQTDIDWSAWASKFFANQKGVNDELNWNMFAYSIQLTKQPQYVSLGSNKGGHAMIVYRIKGGNLYVADPNYPGDTGRRIEYSADKFKPYESGANLEEIKKGNSISFTQIGYTAQSSRVDWNKMTQRWQEFKNKTIGNDKFPAYRLVWVDDKGTFNDLKDGFVSPVKSLKMGATGAPAGIIRYGFFRDGNLVADPTRNIELNPGTNKIGILVNGIVNTTDSTGNPVQEADYIDFRYINIVYNAPSGSLAIKPENESIETGQKLVLTVTSSKPPAKPSYEWVVGSSELKLAPFSRKNTLEKTYDFDATEPGTYEVTVIESDAATGKPTGSTGKTTVVIKAKNFDRIGMLHKQLGIVLRLYGKHTYSDWAAPDTTTATTREESISCPFNYNNELTVMPISWTGNSFAGKFTWGSGDNQRVYTVTGSVSADGTTLTNLTSSYAEKSRGSSGGGDRTVKITASNIPIWVGNTPSITISGPDAAKYVTGISLVVNSDRIGGGKISSRQYISTDWTKGSIQLVFSPTIDSYVTGSNGEFKAR